MTPASDDRRILRAWQTLRAWPRPKPVPRAGTATAQRSAARWGDSQANRPWRVGSGTGVLIAQRRPPAAPSDIIPKPSGKRSSARSASDRGGSAACTADTPARIQRHHPGDLAVQVSECAATPARYQAVNHQALAEQHNTTSQTRAGAPGDPTARPRMRPPNARRRRPHYFRSQLACSPTATDHQHDSYANRRIRSRQVLEALLDPNSRPASRPRPTPQPSSHGRTDLLPVR